MIDLTCCWFFVCLEITLTTSSKIVVGYWELLRCFWLSLLFRYYGFVHVLWFDVFLFVVYHFQVISADLFLFKVIWRHLKRISNRIIYGSLPFNLSYWTTINLHRVHRRPQRVLEQLFLILLFRPSLLLEILLTHLPQAFLFWLNIKSLINSSIRAIQLIINQKLLSPLYLFLILRLFLRRKINLGF